jgi:hypothetical protein
VTLQTDEDLTRRLQGELAWRRKELHEYFSLVRSSTTPKVHLFIRGAIAVLYAHWEGFVRSAGEAYLDFVRIRRLTYSEVATNFIALALHKKLQEAHAAGSVSAYRELVSLLLGPMSERVSLPKKNAINTRAWAARQKRPGCARQK